MKDLQFPVGISNFEKIREGGNYYIDKITHSLSGSYTCSYECSNVNNENSEETEAATGSASGGSGTASGEDEGGSTHEERMNAVLEGTDYTYNPSGLQDASSGAVRV